MADFVFPNLEDEIERKGIRKSKIAEALGITKRAFHNKQIGIFEFKLSEAFTIQEVFFPECDLRYLFSRKRERRLRNDTETDEGMFVHSTVGGVLITSSPMKQAGNR